MKIKKIKSDGQFIYPATIAAAVKDANFLKEDKSPMTQGEVNLYLYKIASNSETTTPTEENKYIPYDNISDNGAYVLPNTTLSIQDFKESNSQVDISGQHVFVYNYKDNSHSTVKTMGVVNSDVIAVAASDGDVMTGEGASYTMMAGANMDTDIQGVYAQYILGNLQSTGILQGYQLKFLSNPNESTAGEINIGYTTDGNNLINDGDLYFTVGGFGKQNTTYALYNAGLDNRDPIYLTAKDEVLDGSSISLDVKCNTVYKGNNPLTSLSLSYINSDQETLIYFQAASSGCTLSINSSYDVIGVLTIHPNKKYVISILNGVIIMGEIE